MSKKPVLVGPQFESASFKPNDIVIVGQGYSGITTLFNLIEEIKRSKKPEAYHGTNIVWMDPGCSADMSKLAKDRVAMGGVFKEGLPDCYRTTTPAWTQSLIGDDIGDFTKWLQERRPDATADTFTSRSDMGHYLRQRVGEALDEAKRLGINVELSKAAVTDVQKKENGTLAVKYKTDQGESTLNAGQIILATGHQAKTPEWAKAIETDQSYVGSPGWYEKMKPLAKAERVTLVGFGNTGLDAVRVLESLGFKGTYNVVSPTQKLGFHIESHDPYHPKPWAQADDHAVLDASTAKPMVAIPTSFYDDLATEIGKAKAAGKKSPADAAVVASEHFYAVQRQSDGLKKTDPAHPVAYFPNNMPSEEQFLEELGKRGVDRKSAKAVAVRADFYGYDCMAPESIELVRQLRDSGRMKNSYGRVEQITLASGSAAIVLRKPDGTTEMLKDMGPVVNCAPWQRGVQTNTGLDPLYKSMHDQGLVKIDRNNLVRAGKDSGVTVIGVPEMQHWGVYEIAELAIAKVKGSIVPKLKASLRHGVGGPKADVAYGHELSQ